jgi:hypothetical protein
MPCRRLVVALTVTATAVLGLGAVSIAQALPSAGPIVASDRIAPINVSGPSASDIAVTANGVVRFSGGSVAACAALLGPAAGCKATTDPLATMGSVAEHVYGAHITGIAVTFGAHGFWLLASDRGNPLAFGDANAFTMTGEIQPGYVGRHVPPLTTIVSMAQWVAKWAAPGKPQTVETQYVAHFPAYRGHSASDVTFTETTEFSWAR